MIVHNRIRRPKILITAAKIGARDYRRGRTVSRLMNTSVQKDNTAVINALVDAEEQIETSRIASDPGYSARRHIEILMALISERRNSSSSL